MRESMVTRAAEGAAGWVPQPATAGRSAARTLADAKRRTLMPAWTAPGGRRFQRAVSTVTDCGAETATQAHRRPWKA